MVQTLRLLAAMLVLPWAGLVMHAQQEDGHDKLVYGRYSRKLQSSPIKYEFDMTFPELDRPATPHDVAGGKAVFSLESLGQAHVWKLPKCPILRCGQWKRYFGFVGSHGATVVPAGECRRFAPQDHGADIWGRQGTMAQVVAGRGPETLMA